MKKLVVNGPIDHPGARSGLGRTRGGLESVFVFVKVQWWLPWAHGWCFCTASDVKEMGWY